MKQRLSIVVLSVAAILSISCLYFLLNLFSPSSAGPLGVLVVFASIYVFSFSTLSLVARMLESVNKALRPRCQVGSQVQRDKQQIHQKRTNLIAAVLSLAPIFLVSLNSIGELGFTDISLIIIIESLLIFYIFKKV